VGVGVGLGVGVGVGVGPAVGFDPAAGVAAGNGEFEAVEDKAPVLPQPEIRMAAEKAVLRKKIFRDDGRVRCIEPPEKLPGGYGFIYSGYIRRDAESTPKRIPTNVLAP
jgi:hypothetical protein